MPRLMRPLSPVSRPLSPVPRPPSPANWRQTANGIRYQEEECALLHGEMVPSLQTDRARGGGAERRDAERFVREGGHRRQHRRGQDGADHVGADLQVLQGEARGDMVSSRLGVDLEQPVPAFALPQPSLRLRHVARVTLPCMGGCRAHMEGPCSLSRRHPRV